MSAERELRVERSPSHCPFCKDALDDLGKIVACAACGARHHSVCHAENGRCATCGSAATLVPTAARRRASEPLAGSVIRVREEGAITVLTWPATHPPPRLLLAGGLFLLSLGALACGLGAVPPLVVIPSIAGTVATFLFLIWRRKLPPLELRLGPDAIEFDAIEPSRNRAVRVRASPGEVGAIKTEHVGTGYRLTIDVGLVRHVVQLGAPAALDPIGEPETDWLARTIEAWRGGA